MNSFIKVQFLCASCGRAKQASNHWYIVVKVGPTRQQGLEFVQPRVLYFTAPLDPARSSLADNEFPVCGEGCLNKIEAHIREEKPS